MAAIAIENHGDFLSSFSARAVKNPSRVYSVKCNLARGCGQILKKDDPHTDESTKKRSVLGQSQKALPNSAIAERLANTKPLLMRLFSPHLLILFPRTCFFGKDMLWYYKTYP